MASKKQDNEIVEPKVVETLEEVENVSEEELNQLDNDIQQQKAESASSPTKSALAAQTNLRTLSEIVDDLKKPIHPKYLRKLNAGPAKGASYIPWPFATKYLDHFAPGWQSQIQVVEGPYGATVITHISIPTSDFGVVTRGGVGFEPHVTHKGTDKEKLTGFGGASAIAERMSFKRSCAMWGLGKYLYEK